MGLNAAQSMAILRTLKTKSPVHDLSNTSLEQSTTLLQKKTEIDEKLLDSGFNQLSNIRAGSLPGEKITPNETATSW